ncbi:MAG: peptidylprolyl isomerase [Chloroflexota bacterium]
MQLWKRKGGVSSPASRRRQGRQDSKWGGERVILLLGLIAILAALGLLGFALYNRQITIPREPLARVNGVPVTARQLVQELRWLGAAQSATQEGIVNALDSVVASMQNEELVNQESQRLDLSVTEAEIDQYIQKAFQGETGSTVEERYRERLRRLRLSEAEYRSQVKQVLLQSKLNEYLIVQFPKEAEQVYLHAIEVDRLDLAEELRGRLAAGDDFASLAKTYSLDPVSGPGGGEVGWRPQGARPFLEEAAFGLALNRVSDPIPGPQGRLFLIKVTAKEVRVVEEVGQKERDDNALSALLGQTRKESKIESYSIKDEVISWVLDRVNPGQR